MKMIQVLKAAIKYKGIVYSLPKPARHHDVIKLIHEKTGDINIIGDQGFLLDEGLFVNRYIAMKFATRAGQLKNKEPISELYSEDLW